MVLRVHLSSGRIVRGYCVDSIDAMRLLRSLANEGHVCERWFVEVD